MVIMVNNKKSKILKISRLLFLIVLLVSNTFAWFIYATKIDNTISVHVRAWDVVFEAGENTVTDTINLTVDSIYPGMEDYEYVVTAYNRSEVDAILSYQILEARILDTSYMTVEGRADLGEPADESDITSSQLESILLNNYPFTISVSLSDTQIDLDDGEEDYTFSVVWPYESNNDALDTQWGIAAATYKESNPSDSSIAIKIKIIITQSTS